MRVNKMLNIDRFGALQKVVYYFVCKTVCGRNYGRCGHELENCDRIAQVDREMAAVVLNLKSPIIKEVAVLTNGFNEDN